MSITFENNYDGIVYDMEKIISFSPKHEYLFVAQCVWWLSAIIGLQQGLIIHIDTLQSRAVVADKEANDIPAQPVTSKVNNTAKHLD